MFPQNLELAVMNLYVFLPLSLSLYSHVEGGPNFVIYWFS